MFFLKKINFNKSIYKLFYQNLEEADKMKCAVVFWEVKNDQLTIMIIISFKAIIIKNIIGQPLKINPYFFPNYISKKEDFILINDLVLNSKHNAFLIKSHSLIETLSEIINKVKIIQQLSLEKQHKIWMELFSLDPTFFLNNDLIKLPLGINNWVD